MATIVVCIIAGMGAGLGTGFAGMSAACVITPMLVTFLDMNVYEAIGISLSSDVLASAVSAYTYGKNKNIDIKNSKSLLITVLIFTFIGSIISHLVPSVTLGNFSIYMSFLMGLKFLFTTEAQLNKETIMNFSDKWKKILPVLCGIVIGFICGFIGAGGGIMMLVLLTVVLKYDLKIAVGTSVFIMTFTALFGATSHFVLEGVFPNVLVLSICASSTLIFALLGARFANKAKPIVLHRAIGAVLSSLGLLMIIVNNLDGIQSFLL